MIVQTQKLFYFRIDFLIFHGLGAEILECDFESVNVLILFSEFKIFLHHVSTEDTWSRYPRLRQGIIQVDYRRQNDLKQ